MTVPGCCAGRLRFRQPARGSAGFGRWFLRKELADDVSGGFKPGNHARGGGCVHPTRDQTGLVAPMMCCKMLNERIRAAAEIRQVQTEAMGVALISWRFAGSGAPIPIHRGKFRPVHPDTSMKSMGRAVMPILASFAQPEVQTLIVRL